VLGEHGVFDVDDAVRVRGDIALMGDESDGVALLPLSAFSVPPVPDMTNGTPAAQFLLANLLCLAHNSHTHEYVCLHRGSEPP